MKRNDAHEWKKKTPMCQWNDLKIITMRKRGVLQQTLQLNLWVAPDTCKSFYLYAMSANKQVTWVVKLQVTIYKGKSCSSPSYPFIFPLIHLFFCCSSLRWTNTYISIFTFLNKTSSNFFSFNFVMLFKWWSSTNMFSETWWY